MKKTGGQIESDVYALISASDLKGMIGGTIYKDGMRPVNSDKEDVVVVFAGGLDAQFQSGIVIVNIFVPNINNGGTKKVKNIARCTALETEANEWLMSLKPTDYRFSLDSIISSKQALEIDQHYVNIRIKFDYKTF